MSCTALGASPQVWEIIWCGIEMASGSYAMAALLIFVLLLFGMYKLKLPFMVQVPVGIMFLFAFAGAGLGTPIGGFQTFVSMMWIVLIITGAVALLVFWRLRK